MVKGVRFLSVIISLAMELYAQESLRYQHYAMTPSAINHAASLMGAGGEISLIGRRQWVGIDGAPTLLMANSYWRYPSIAAASGISVMQDRVGDENRIEFTPFVAKSVRLSRNLHLGVSFNLGIGYYRLRVPQDEAFDPVFSGDLTARFFSLGYGVLLFSPDQFYMGLSYPRVPLNKETSAGGYQLVAGKSTVLGPEWQLRIAGMLSTFRGKQVLYSGSAMIFFKRLAGLGVDIRSTGNMGGLLQWNQATFSIGYGYQFAVHQKPANSVMRNATHEIALRYRWENSS